MDYIYTMLILMSFYIVLAASFDLIIGYGGLISIAHPAFYALGAYTSGLLARDLGVPVPVAILAGTLMAVVTSLAIALPSIRISGDYLLIASIGFQLGLLEAIKNLDWTGGPGGLGSIPPLFEPSAGLLPPLALAVIVAIVSVLLIRWITHGPYGRAMAAMRDDEQAFAALGRDATTMKIVIFAAGSGMAGLIGGMYAHTFRFLSPAQFEIHQSAALLTMVVVGGMRTTWGPVVGAIALQFMPQAITFLNLPPSILGPVQGILFTGLVLIFMFSRPQGLVPARSVWRSLSGSADVVRRA